MTIAKKRGETAAQKVIEWRSTLIEALEESVFERSSGEGTCYLSIFRVSCLARAFDRLQVG